jgi:hypothetical protein
MNSWMPLLVALPLIGVIVWQQWLMAEKDKRWMRLFSASQQIPVENMEDKPLAEEHPVIKAAVRKRISIPIPGASMFRPNGGGKPHA